MIFLKCLISALSVATVCVSAIDPGPHTFSQSTPAPAASTYRPRYVMRDAILYLTPSQIKKLEATKGLNKVIPLGNTNDNEEIQKTQYSEQELLSLEEIIRKQLIHQNIYQNHGVNLEHKIPAQLVNPHIEKPIAFSPAYAQPLVSQPLPLIAQPISLPLPRVGPNYILPLSSAKPLAAPESYSFIKTFADKAISEVPRIQLYSPLHQQKLSDPLLHQNFLIQDPIYNKRYKLVPYSYDTDNLKFLEHLYPNLDHVISKDIESPELSKHIKNEEKKFEEQSEVFPKYLSALKYAPQYVSHKIATEFQKLLSQIEKDKAKKSPVAHQSGSLKLHKQESLANHVTISPLQSYFEPLEVKIPQSYISLSNRHSIPISFENAEKAEIERAEAFQIEKQLDGPLSSNLFVIKDKPFVADQYLPANLKKESSSDAHQKPDSLYRHLFNNN